MTADQDEVIAFLAAGAGSGKPASRIDTHISVVFLGTDRVLKMKRAVKLPFLDNSTLEMRRRCCLEELVVNARNAPAIYRRVVPITRQADGLALGGQGRVVEWVVEMARFDETKTLDRLAADHALPSSVAETLADTMLASHADAPVADGLHWPASISSIIDRNTEMFRHQAALPAGPVARLHEISQSLLHKHLSLIQQRATGGMVRRCHGDAHLANIVMINNKPVLFDAIEFDPVIATIDVLYDLAFPIMDFLHFGYSETANRLLNRYLQYRWLDHGHALRLLPLFLSIRAAVRALVSLIKHDQYADDPTCLSDAKAYFELAVDLVQPTKPCLIAIGGRSGTGKSLLARAVAGNFRPPPGAILLRSDNIRKELAGVDPMTRLPISAYTAESSAMVYGEMFARAQLLLSQGFSTILDAAFLDEDERREAADIARVSGAAFHGLFLTAAPEVRANRVNARHNDASDATVAIALYQETLSTGVIDWLQIDAAGTPAQTLENARHALEPSMVHIRNVTERS